MMPMGSGFQDLLEGVGSVAGTLVQDMGERGARDLFEQFQGLGARAFGTLESALGFSLWADPGGTGAEVGSVQALDIALLAVIGLVVIAAVRVRHATARHRLDLARRMVERGMEPHDELVGATPEQDLRRGLVLVFAGGGLLAASFMGGRGEMSPAGLIPGFIGFGYLVSYWLGVARRDRERERERGRTRRFEDGEGRHL